jgi:hypothetical protein
VGSYNASLDTATSERILTEINTFQAPAMGAGAFIPLMLLGVITPGIALWRGTDAGGPRPSWPRS